MAAPSTVGETSKPTLGPPPPPPEDPSSDDEAVRGPLALALLLGSLALAGSAAALVLAGPPRPTPAGVALALVLALACLALNARPFAFPWRGERLGMTLDEAVLFLALTSLPPPLAPFILLPGVALAQRVRRRALRKSLFNVGTQVGGAGAAVAVTGLLSPVGGGIVAAVAAVGTYSLVTHGLVALVIARVGREPWARVLRGVLVPVALQIAIGVAVATSLIALWRLHPLAVVAVAPIVLLARGYVRLRTLAARRAEAHRRLAELMRPLARNPDEAAVAESILDACGRLLPALRARLTLEGEEAPTWVRGFGGREARTRTLRAPLEGRGGESLGLLEVEVRPPHDAAHVEMLHLIAAEAAASLENARFYAAQRRARDAAEAAAQAREASLRALAQSEARLQGILDHAPAAIFVKDLEGRYVVVNRRAEQAAGLPPGTMVGKTDFDFLPREAALRVAENDRLVRESGEPREIEIHPPGLGGARTFLSLTFPLLDAQGHVSALCSIATDVTDRRAAQAEIDAARAEVAASQRLSALGSLVSGVAHEIRTPLTYMSNHLFLIRQRLDRLARARPDLATDVAQLHALLGAAEEGGERVNHLVRDLRRFTQLRPDQRAAEPLEAVVREALALFGATNRARLRLETDLAPSGLPTLDRVQVQQVVLNLLTNAAESGAATIRVRTDLDGSHARLTVEDDGPGIPPAVQARMWEPFYTTKQEGTGLGLSTVRRIVENHGGRIECESAAGGGTRFTVLLPLAPGAAPLPETR